MHNKTAFTRALALLAFAALAAKASPVSNSGLECDLYQWTNSGPVVTTWQSLFDVGNGSGETDLFSGGNGHGHSGSSNPDSDHPDGFNPGHHGDDDLPCPPQAVPEPGSLALLGLGLLALGLMRRSNA